MNDRYRKLQLGILVIIVILLSLDWQTVTGHPACVGGRVPCNSSQWNEKRPADPAFLLKQYDSAVHEIEKRLDQEQTMFVLKFSLAGAILALMFSYLKRSKDSDLPQKSSLPTHALEYLRSEPLAAAFFWAAVAVSAVIDIRIGFNASFIQSLGDWVMQLECTQLTDVNLGWEHFLRDEYLSNSRAYSAIRLNSTILTDLLFLVAAFFFGSQSQHQGSLKSNETSVSPAIVTAIGSCLCVLILTCVGIAYHPTCREWVEACLGLGAVGAVLAIALARRRVGSQTSEGK